MEVRPGYKQTEVGVIPEDWESRPFAYLYAEPSRNGIYKTSEFHGRGTRIVNMGEMFGFEFISDQEMSRVHLTARELAISGLSNGDLLFGRRSVVPSGAGKCSIVVNPTEVITFESSVIRVRLNSVVTHPLFYYYFFASAVGRSTVGSIVSGTNVKGIRATELRDLSVPRPPLAEQRAIATALSDVDALLAKLDALIAKKRDLKVAAMQQLLTGQTRLPGFSGAWEVKRLGDVASAMKGMQLHKSESSEGGRFAHLNGGITPSGFTETANTPGETIAISEGGNSCGFVQFMAEPYWCGGHCYSVMPRGIDKGFLYHALKGQQATIMGLRVGSGLPNVQKTALLNFSLSLPPDRNEQAAIATVLSDMDTELTALEARRDKTRALKQGMMQELLTGKIRLVSSTPQPLGDGIGSANC